MKKTISIILLLLTSFTINAQTETVEELIKLGKEADFNGNRDKAIEYFKKALTIDKNAPESNFEIARIYYRIEKYKDAIKHLDIVIATENDYTTGAYITKGRVLRDYGKIKDAIKTFKEGIAKYSEDHYMPCDIAEIYYEQKNYKLAEEYSLKSVENNLLYVVNHRQLAYSTYAQNKRIPTILALYFYLWLYPDSKTSAEDLKLLKTLLTQEISNKNTYHKYPSNSIDSSFIEAESSLSSINTINDSLKQTSKHELFKQQTLAFFNLMGALRTSEKNNFWWKFYVKFYSDLLSDGYFNVFCSTVNKIDNNPTYKDWDEKTYDWFMNYLNNTATY